MKSDFDKRLRVAFWRTIICFLFVLVPVWAITYEVKHTAKMFPTDLLAVMGLYVVILCVYECLFAKLREVNREYDEGKA